jgi:hypothetical protein
MQNGFHSLVLFPWLVNDAVMQWWKRLRWWKLFSCFLYCAGSEDGFSTANLLALHDLNQGFTWLTNRLIRILTRMESIQVLMENNTLSVFYINLVILKIVVSFVSYGSCDCFLKYFLF